MVDKDGRRSPPWNPPASKTKVTIMGKNEIYKRENLMGALFGAQHFASQTPPPPRGGTQQKRHPHTHRLTNTREEFSGAKGPGNILLALKTTNPLLAHPQGVGNIRRRHPPLVGEATRKGLIVMRPHCSP